jgi:hypothetical protein
VGRRLLFHGFLLLLVALLLGFPTAAGASPSGRAWMTAHVGTIIGSLVLIAAGLAWSEVRLGEKGARIASRLLVAAAYAGTFLNIFAAATELPGPATAPGQDPATYQAIVLVAALLVIVPGFVGGIGMMVYGLSKEQ